MFAPEAMATSWRLVSCEGFEATYFFRPARESAPAGSRMERVSSKTSLMAAQISSVSTWMTSSTTSLATRKVSSPTVLTAAPSAKRPTSLRVTRSLSLSD